jgi:hypothetical protein
VPVFFARTSIFQLVHPSPTPGVVAVASVIRARTSLASLNGLAE